VQALSLQPKEINVFLAKSKLLESLSMTQGPFKVGKGGNEIDTFFRSRLYELKNRKKIEKEESGL